MEYTKYMMYVITVLCCICVYAPVPPCFCATVQLCRFASQTGFLSQIGMNATSPVPCGDLRMKRMRPFAGQIKQTQAKQT